MMTPQKIKISISIVWVVITLLFVVNESSGSQHFSVSSFLGVLIALNVPMILYWLGLRRRSEEFLFRPLSTGLWHVGIVPLPVADFLRPGTLGRLPVTWLPEPNAYCYIADPFGIWRECKLWIFVEALDYRTKRGEIHYYCYDAAMTLLSHGTALRMPYHLSYPQIIEEGGETYMLPEGHKSGVLTLYKATRFPDRWEPVATLMDQPTIDASILKHHDIWWMFYALPGENQRAQRVLHVAYADHLTGPWHPHPQNPVRTALDSARPGGQPFLHEGAIHLPTQDCTKEYGGALSILRFDELTKTTCATQMINHLSPGDLLPRYTQGMHTLSTVGDWCLLDGKRIEISHYRRLINAKRSLRKILSRH